MVRIFQLTFSRIPLIVNVITAATVTRLLASGHSVHI